MKREPKQSNPSLPDTPPPGVKHGNGGETSVPGTDRFPEAEVVHPAKARKSPSTSINDDEIRRVAEALYQDAGEVPTVVQIQTVANCRRERAVRARIDLDDRIAAGKLERLAVLSAPGHAAVTACVGRLERSFLETASTLLEQVRVQDRQLIVDAERRCEGALSAAAALLEQNEGLKVQLCSQDKLISEVERSLRLARLDLETSRMEFVAMKAVADERGNQLLRMTRPHPTVPDRENEVQVPATSAKDGQAPSAGSDN